MTWKPRSQSSDRKKLWVLLLAVIVLIMIYSGLPGEQQPEGGLSPDSQIEKLSQPQFSFESSSAEETNETNSPRLVFPYSVISGGVRDAEELKNAIQKDLVVAEHYSDFNLAKAKVVSLPRERFAYVSYRMNDQVYWTKRKLKLAKGETVLTDGKNYARGRCGNRITEVSQVNTSPHEPKPQVFDTPIKLDTAVPLRMAYSPQMGPLQLAPGLISPSGEASTELTTTALGGQARGGSGFYGGGPAGFVGGYIPGSSAGGGGGSPGSGGSSPTSGPGGSTSPAGGGKSSGPNGGSGNSGSPGGVVGGGDSGNQANGQGSSGGSGSNSPTPPITGNENGLPNNPSSGSGGPGNGSGQGGNDSSTSGSSTPPAGNGSDNPGNSGDIHSPGHSDAGDKGGSNSNILSSSDSPPPVQVPEPSTLVLMLSGLSGYLTLKKFSKKNFS